ncbi:MAG: hypothetical protein LUE10_00060 [Alistipes sp.]|nr:hypothetical protein [Alistipes sp.]
MKNMFSYIFAAAAFFAACSDSDDTPGGGGIDITTDFIAAGKKGGYDIHFKPLSGWFGDPIPYYAQGEFYVYYLHDWRTIYPAFLHPWHLVTSPDAGTWSYRGEVLPVGKSDEQDAALCTGGIVRNRETGQYHMFYAGHRQSNAVYPTQAVLQAVSSDLRNWIKDKSFYLAVSGSGYNRDDFRDPHVYWDEQAGLYRMLVTAQLNGRAAVAQYTSPDLYHWDMKEPFYTDSSASIYECVDVFQEGGFWYMVYSNVNDRKVHYKYSRSQDGPWITPDHPAFDGIAYYAGKTATDGTRRYLFGWCPTRIGDGDPDQWGGSMVTHRLIQNSDGTLSVDIPPAQDKRLSTPP